MVTRIETMSRVQVGGIITIIAAIIATGGSIIVSKVSASAQIQSGLNDLKLQTTKDITVVQGKVETLEAVNTDIKNHLDRIDSNLETQASAMQSLTSYIINSRR